MARYRRIRETDFLELLWLHHPLLVGYLWAVTGASVTFAAIIVASASMAGFASVDPLLERIWGSVLTFFVWAQLFWICALPMALPPFALSWQIAKKFEIGSFVYYVLCGAMAGLVLTPVFEELVAPEVRLSDDPTFLQDCIRWWPTFILSGTCGALAFWYRTGRHLGRILANMAQPQSTL